MVKISKKLVKFCHFCFFSKTLLNFYVTWTLNIHQKNFWIVLVIFGNNPRGKTQLSFFTLFFFKRLYFRPEVQSAKILGRPDQQIRMFLTKKKFGVVPQILTIIWGVHGGGEHYVPPPTNPNRDFVPVYARRNSNTFAKKKHTNSY